MDVKCFKTSALVGFTALLSLLLSVNNEKVEPCSIPFTLVVYIYGSFARKTTSSSYWTTMFLAMVRPIQYETSNDMLTKLQNQFQLHFIVISP